MIKKILIGAGATIGAGLIMTATGWNFLVTANMPDKFVTKQDFNLAIKTLSECNERNHDRINDKLDRIYDILVERHDPASTSAFEFDADFTGFRGSSGR